MPFDPEIQDLGTATRESMWRENRVMALTVGDLATVLRRMSVRDPEGQATEIAEAYHKWLADEVADRKSRA